MDGGKFPPAFSPSRKPATGAGETPRSPSPRAPFSIDQTLPQPSWLDHERDRMLRRAAELARDVVGCASLFVVTYGALFLPLLFGE